MIHPTSHSFSEYYKTITDSELLLILENPDDYQEDAVEAAKKELQRRQLSSTELEGLKNYLAEKRSEKEQAKQKREEVQRTIKERWSDVLESLNPIHEELPGAEKIIRFIVIFWGY